MLSLDSDVIVGLLRGEEAELRARFDQTRLSATPLGLSSIVLHELVTGAVASRRPDRHLDALAVVSESFEPLEFTGEDAIRAAQVRAELAKEGRPIGALDTLIAGQALARDLIVVTSNIRHFGRVAGLKLIDWRVGPDIMSSDAVAARLA